MDRMQPKRPAHVAPSRTAEVHHHVEPVAGRATGTVKKRWTRRKIMVASLIVVVVALSVVVWKVIGHDLASGVNPMKYQAVFLSNGQVYFGKISGVGNSYAQLTDVYYLENSAVPQAEGEDAAGAQTGQQLSKLGKEIHKPEDKMIIKTDQIVFIENIENDGSVGKAIIEYKKDK